MKLHSQTLGFLPKVALCEYLQRDEVLGAKIDDRLVGYILFGKNRDYFRLCHLCVTERYQGQGIAKRLVNALKESATTQKAIKLHCRRDFSANQMWPQLGFVPIYEKPGRSAAKHILTLWYLTLAPDEQLEIFQAKTSDETLDIVIDAQIFFHFDRSDDNETRPSRALLSDFLIGSLNFFITDELFVEIDRQGDSDRRERSRNRAYGFNRIEHDTQLAGLFEEHLKEILRSRTPRERSDIRHLAKTGASDVEFFVTRDQHLLQNADAIADVTGLKVLSPTELIIQFHELSEKHSYMPARVSGLSLQWRRLASGELPSFPFSSFLYQGERKGKFRERMGYFLASPTHYECELLWSGNEVCAVRILENSADRTLTVHLSRVARSNDRLLFERFLVADTICKAVNENFDMVKFEATAVTTRLVTDLLETGFTKCNDSFVRFCFPRCFDRQEALGTISVLSPESSSDFQNMSDLEIERHCSPLNLVANQGHFLIPIRPGYAISLFDRHQSANDLFGGKKSVLLRWDNVYYRRKTHHKILSPPARILWYVSGNVGEIVAVSHLDAVEIDIPKALFRKFKKIGILKWKDLWDMCGGDPSSEIMALRFSHTFLLRAPISLKNLRDVFKKDEVGLTLRSPSIVPTKTFQRLFELGYPSQI